MTTRKSDDSTAGEQESCSIPADSRRDETLRRLRRIEGQVRGIQRMLEQGRECNDVLTQLMAIRSGVEEVSVQIIDLHIERCLFEGIDIDAGKRAELNRSIRLMTRFHPVSAEQSVGHTLPQ